VPSFFVVAPEIGTGMLARVVREFVTKTPLMSFMNMELGAGSHSEKKSIFFNQYV